MATRSRRKKELRIASRNIFEAQAKAKRIRISPYKVQIVLNLIRLKPLDSALAILSYNPKRASAVIYKLLLSAKANALHNNHLPEKDLIVKTCYVTKGPVLKRLHCVSKGRGHQILKRTSNIVLIVGTKNKTSEATETKEN